MGVCQSSKEKRPKYHKNSSIAVDQIPEENFPGLSKDNKPIERYLIEGNTAKIRELIERREIDVNRYDYEGSIMTILHKAVQTSDNPELIELVLSRVASSLVSYTNQLFLKKTLRQNYV